MKVEAAPGAIFVNGKLLLVYRADAPTPARFEPSLEVLRWQFAEAVPRHQRPVFRSAAPTEGDPADRFRRRRHLEALSQVGASASGGGDLRRSAAAGRSPLGSGDRGRNEADHSRTAAERHVQADGSVHGFQPHQESGHDVDDARALPHVARRDLALGVLRRRRMPWIRWAISKDVRPCLQYFVEHQSGVGKFGKDIAPDGDVSLLSGRFCGLSPLDERDRIGPLHVCQSLPLLARRRVVEGQSSRPSWPRGSGSKRNETAPGCATTRACALITTACCRRDAFTIGADIDSISPSRTDIRTRGWRRWPRPSARPVCPRPISLPPTPRIIASASCDVIHRIAIHRPGDGPALYPQHGVLPPARKGRHPRARRGMGFRRAAIALRHRRAQSGRRRQVLGTHVGAAPASHGHPRRPDAPLPCRRRGGRAMDHPEGLALLVLQFRRAGILSRLRRPRRIGEGPVGLLHEPRLRRVARPLPNRRARQRVGLAITRRFSPIRRPTAASSRRCGAW